MEQYVALLRGIAPSGPGMRNDDLRGALERLGLGSVRSVLASGNLLFRAPAGNVPELERRVEAALAADLGLRSATMIRTGDELRALLGSDPFPGLRHGPDTYLTATFLKQDAAAPAGDAGLRTPALATNRLDARTTVVRVDAGARAVLAVTRANDRGAGAAYARWLESAYGRGTTTRSWRTVQRIGRALDG